MQLFNKVAIKKTLYHTWYIYPITIAITTLLLRWGFQAYHQPSEHQKLTIFLSADVRDESFLTKILNKYDKEKLREVNPYYMLPEAVGYYQKVKLYVDQGDIVILNETTFNYYKDHYGEYFASFNDQTKEKYVPSGSTYYTYDDKDYGVLLKKKGESHYLQSYMDFVDEDYYIALPIASVNLGDLVNKDNGYYDNALTFMNHLLVGNL